MRISLPSGKYVEITTDMFFNLTDEQFADEITDLMAHDIGIYQPEDPFEGSSLRSGTKKALTEDSEELREITDVPIEEKLREIDPEED